MAAVGEGGIEFVPGEIATLMGDSVHDPFDGRGGYRTTLPADAYALWQMMDGTKSVRTIAVEYSLAYKQLVTGLLRGLIEALRGEGDARPTGARAEGQDGGA